VGEESEGTWGGVKGEVRKRMCVWHRLMVRVELL
jgi:hypothetical protein